MDSLILKAFHHDIMTIMELFFILTIVELLQRATTKSFCHQHYATYCNERYVYEE